VRALVLALVACSSSEAPAPPPPSGLPAIDGATVLARSSDRATLCLAGDAIDQITAALRRDGWTDIRTQNARDRVAIAAVRGAEHLSATTAHDARCAGTVVLVTVLQLPAAR